MEVRIVTWQYICVTDGNSTYLLLLLFIWTANGVLPGGSGTRIAHNTRIYTNNNGHATVIDFNSNTITTTPHLCASDVRVYAGSRGSVSPYTYTADRR